MVPIAISIAAASDLNPTIPAGATFDIIGAVLCVVGVIAMANLVGVAWRSRDHRRSRSQRARRRFCPASSSAPSRSRSGPTST